MPIGPGLANVPAVVNFINVLPSDFLGQCKAPYAGIWEDYYIQNSYETDGHIYQMGISSPNGFAGQSVAFVQLASNTLLWTCNWITTMQGASPTLPDPITLNDGNWILLDQHIEPQMVDLLPDGESYVYTIRGTYYYGHTNPDQAQVVYPAAPWLLDIDPALRLVTPLQFQGGLTDAPIGPPSMKPPSAGDVGLKPLG